jgi:hypothetical protein
MFKMFKNLFSKKVEYVTPLEKAYQRAVNEIYSAKKNGQTSLLFHHYDATTTDKMVEMLSGRFVAFKSSIHTITIVIY